MRHRAWGGTATALHAGNQNYQPTAQPHPGCCPDGNKRCWPFSGKISPVPCREQRVLAGMEHSGSTCRHWSGEALLLSHAAAVWCSNQGFFYCFLTESNANFCPRKNKSTLDLIKCLNQSSHHQRSQFLLHVLKSSKVFLTALFPKRRVYSKCVLTGFTQSQCRFRWKKKKKHPNS